jgi:hypothetical protein
MPLQGADQGSRLFGLIKHEVMTSVGDIKPTPCVGIPLECVAGGLASGVSYAQRRTKAGQVIRCQNATYSLTYAGHIRGVDLVDPHTAW